MGFDLHLGTHEEQRPFQARVQRLMFTGVGLQDARHGALLAVGSLPFQASAFEQAAGFRIASAMVVAEKMRAFLASWRDHVGLDAGDVVPAAGIDFDHVALGDKGRHLHFEAGFGGHGLVHAGGGVAFHRGLCAGDGQFNGGR